MSTHQTPAGPGQPVTGPAGPVPQLLAADAGGATPVPKGEVGAGVALPIRNAVGDVIAWTQVDAHLYPALSIWRWSLSEFGVRLELGCDVHQHLRGAPGDPQADS